MEARLAEESHSATEEAHLALRTSYSLPTGRRRASYCVSVSFAEHWPRQTETVDWTVRRSGGVCQRATRAPVAGKKLVCPPTLLSPLRKRGRRVFLPTKPPHRHFDRPRPPGRSTGKAPSFPLSGDGLSVSRSTAVPRPTESPGPISVPCRPPVPGRMHDSLAYPTWGGSGGGRRAAGGGKREGGIRA